MTQSNDRAVPGGDGIPPQQELDRGEGVWPQIQRTLHERGFVVLTENRTDPSKDGRFEAWAYAGPMDFGAAAALAFGVGHSIRESLESLEGQLASQASVTAATHQDQPKTLPISDRERATILAALRYHQAENLQDTTAIPDQAIREIATDGGRLAPLDAGEVDDLCERINASLVKVAVKGFWIEAPRKVSDPDPLYRVLYVIDLNAADPEEAARKAHRYMASPTSMAPSLDVIDHTGHVVTIDVMDLPEEEPTPASGPHVHPFLQRVYDLLYLDVDEDRDFYNPDKSWDGADFLDMIAEELSAYIPPPCAETAGPRPSTFAPGEAVSESDGLPPADVIITVRGGVADVVLKARGTALALYDYDVDGSEDVDQDPDGALCHSRQWPRSSQVIGEAHWPSLAAFRNGAVLSCSRQWECPECHRVIDHSYDALADVGIPICSDCDVDMEII